ncbi:MAG: caspase family protein [Nitratireductor sp.]|nr:caspase family protein [Nitratireductor sp.]
MRLAFLRNLKPEILAGLVVSMIFMAQPAQAGGRFALVVGNSAYVNAPQLTNPANDSALMARTLESAGFTVTLVGDADYRSLKKALLDFGRQLRGEDIEAGLFYYAGHGLQVKGENYLVPVNAAITSEDEVALEAININDFLQVMNSSDAKVNIVILDACRDNPFKGASRSMSRGLAPVDAPKGTYIAYATAPGDVALDGTDGNSPYTKALAQAMSEPGLPIERVFKKARVSVLAETGEKQVPWEVSSITGEFFFKENGANATAGENSRESVLTKPVLPKILTPGELLKTIPPKLALPEWVGRNCSGAAGARICVSSVLEPQKANRYGPGNLVDNNPATAWVEGVNGQGEGEELYIELSAPRSLSSLSFINGYAKNADIFSKNSRIRELTVTTSAGEKKRFALSDNDNWQSANLSGLKPAEWVIIRIDAVFAGSKYQDTAISELRLE